MSDDLAKEFAQSGEPSPDDQHRAALTLVEVAGDDPTRRAFLPTALAMLGLEEAS